MSTFTEHLRGLGPQGLAALLDLRRDLAAPPPATMRALAARASTRASLDRALARVDAGVLAACEAVLVLTAPVTADLVAAALDVDATETARRLAVAQSYALVWADGTGGLQAAPGLIELLGPHPAGLGPSLSDALARRDPSALAELAATLGCPVDALAAHLARPQTVEALLAGAPAGAQSVVDTLAWGPPVGRSPSAGAGRDAVRWLLTHGLLALGDPQHVVLPREVALARRGGALRREPVRRPSVAATVVAETHVAGDAAQHALEAVRLVGEIIRVWGAEPAPALRAGGLGVRELRRLAARLDVPAEHAAVLLEVAGTARLVAEDGEEPVRWCPTTLADEWAASPPAEQWVTLAEAWLAGESAPWLIGTRDETGALRGALDPANRRPWVARLRADTLAVLAEHEGRLDATAVHAQLSWRAPRTPPTEHAVDAVLAEAALLGLTGAGALCPAARALLHSPTAALDVLAASLPTPVDDVLLGGDLTGVVPGRPSVALAALLTGPAGAAEVESRGAGLTVRFTDASIRRALDVLTAEELLAALERHARGRVPQPLTYLVQDAARRHGQVRVGAAGAYLRGDPTALAGIADVPALRGLGLRTLAPGVLVTDAPAAALVEALRAAGVPAALEDGSGATVRARAAQRRVRVRPRAVPPDPELARRRLERVAADLLAGGPDPDGPAPADPPPAPLSAPPGAPPTDTAPTVPATPPTPTDPDDPTEVLLVLREAAARGTDVWLEVAGPGGPTRRRVRPLTVAPGRVRVLDEALGTELTVAVHRLTSAEPVAPPDPWQDPTDPAAAHREGNTWTDL